MSSTSSSAEKCVLYELGPKARLYASILPCRSPSVVCVSVVVGTVEEAGGGEFCLSADRVPSLLLTTSEILTWRCLELGRLPDNRTESLCCRASSEAVCDVALSRNSCFKELTALCNLQNVIEDYWERWLFEIATKWKCSLAGKCG